MVLIDLNILIQDVWLDIKWYYRKVDLEDEGVEYVVELKMIYVILRNPWI
jgi:hypothetical protein